MQRKTDLGPRTSTLLRRLFKASDIKDYINDNETNFKAPDFHDYISQLSVELCKRKESVISCSAIERTYGHQLFNGTRKPSRDKAIQLCFGFGLGIEESQKLLKTAGKSPLYPRIKRDAAILFCIEHKYGIMDAQTMLHELRLCLLGDE